MKKSNPETQEGDDKAFIEAIHQIDNIALGEGAAMCQVCGCELRGGDELTAYAFRAAGNPVFELGSVMCGADEHEHPSVFTRGVHELVVTGRIGVCTDVATQSSWLVLIDPLPVVVSAASASAARMVGDASRDGITESTNDSGHQDGPTPLLVAVREHTRAVMVPAFETEHLDYEFSLLDDAEELTLPDVYVCLEIPLLPPSDGIVTDRHHASADRYEADDPQNPIGGMMSPFPLSGWLRPGCERVVQAAGGTAYHPGKANVDYVIAGGVA